MLWDAGKYAGATKTIDLKSPSDAEHGILEIYGARTEDRLAFGGVNVLKMAGDEFLDFIISSSNIHAKTGYGSVGGIYVLWDIADYYSTASLSINMPAFATASKDYEHSMLSIYGQLGEKLGGAEYDFYKDGAEATDINEGGVNDLVFRDKSHTFILFGEQLFVEQQGGIKARIDLAKVYTTFYFSALKTRSRLFQLRSGS